MTARFRILLPSLLCWALLHAVSATAAESCDTLYAALLKLAQTPNHAFTESSGAIAAGRTRSSERIVTASTTYIQVSGQWRKSTMTPQQALQMEKEALADPKRDTCRYVGEETVDGEPAALFSTAKEDDGGKSEGRIWISKRRGLPLRQQIHLSVGGGKVGESQMTTRYTYDNIQPPAGVR